MRRTVSAIAVSMLATAALLGVSPGVAAADPGGPVVLFHPPKCC